MYTITFWRKKERGRQKYMESKFRTNIILDNFFRLKQADNQILVVVVGFVCWFFFFWSILSVAVFFFCSSFYCSFMNNDENSSLI